MEERYAGSIFNRTNTLLFGEEVESHKHNFDHLTMITKGTCKISYIDLDGIEHEVIKNSGGRLLVRKNIIHKLTPVEALTDDMQLSLDEYKKQLIKLLPDHSDTINNAYNNTKNIINKAPVEYHCLYSRRSIDGELIDDYTGWPDDPMAYR